jgi:dethiobiotin synthase
VVRGLFVTGTDTNVGKTVASAALLCRFRGVVPVRYWKPIQTGIERDDDTGEVRRLSGCGPDEVLDEGVRLPLPVSPHLAARLNGSEIDLEVLAALLDAQAAGPRWIVEGAGGVLVPVDGTRLMIDLIGRLGLPAVVVARTTLGTINHTLLTIEALRARAIRVAGVILAGAPELENRRAIERYGSVEVLGELPLLDPLTPETLGHAAAALDPDRTMLELLL